MLLCPPWVVRKEYKIQSVTFIEGTITLGSILTAALQANEMPQLRIGPGLSVKRC